MTVGEISKYIKLQLVDICDTEEIPMVVSIILEETCQLQSIEVVTKSQMPISEVQQAHIFEIISQLKMGKPIQYITNKAYFYGLEFYVDANVLIPRPETELLVYQVIDFIAKTTINRTGTINILDIGTGSGCIPIALAKKLPDLCITALDISPEALNIAKKNAENNEVSVNFMLKSILDDDLSSLSAFDVIVSNPPYVMDSEKNLMKSRVLDYEPHSALFVPHDNPLLFYEKIANIAINMLKAGGMLIVEINEKLSHETCLLFGEVGFVEILVLTDFRGKCRIVKAIK